MHGKAEFLHGDGADEPPRHVHPSLTTAIASASTISAVAQPDRASAPPDALPLHRISSLPPPLGKPNHGQDLIFRTEARQSWMRRGEGGGEVTEECVDGGVTSAGGWTGRRERQRAAGREVEAEVRMCLG